MRISQLYIFLVVFFLLAGNLTGQQLQSRERLSLDKSWLFHLGDIPFPPVRGHAQSYMTSKAGEATGAASIDYDTRDWEELTLPHDWAVESPYDSTENLSQGYRKRGYGWYRRSFRLDPSDKGKNIELQFDGIATQCEIWVNGIIMHRSGQGDTGRRRLGCHACHRARSRSQRKTGTYVRYPGNFSDKRGCGYNRFGQRRPQQS